MTEQEFEALADGSWKYEIKSLRMQVNRLKEASTFDHSEYKRLRNELKEQLAALEAENKQLAGEFGRQCIRNSELIVENTKLRNLVESCRSSVKFDLLRYERLVLDYTRLGEEGKERLGIFTEETQRLYTLIDSIDKVIHL